MLDKQIFLDYTSTRRHFKVGFPVLEAGIITNHPSETLVRDDTLELCIRFNSTVALSHDMMDDTLYALPFPNVCLKCPGVRQAITVEGSRDAIYFKYSTSCLEGMAAAGLISPPYCWSIKPTPVLLGLIAEFEELAPQIYHDGIGDKIDLLALRFWEETLEARRQGSVHKQEDDRISSLVSWLKIHYLEDIDWDKLFREHGLSRRTFFRLWSKKNSTSPAAMLLGLRLEYAYRLLAKSDTPIWQIADIIHIQSSSYFSRLIREKYGMSPLEIRNSTH